MSALPNVVYATKATLLWLLYCDQCTPARVGTPAVAVADRFLGFLGLENKWATCAIIPA